MSLRIIDDEKLDLDAVSEIRPSFRRITASAGVGCPASSILLLSFAGPYRVGSDGRNDAAFLVAMARAALFLWYADAFILDLRRVDYVWGDDIDGLFDVSRLAGFPLPAAAVACPENHGPLMGIIDSSNREVPVRLFLNLDDAVSHLLAGRS